MNTQMLGNAIVPAVAAAAQAEFNGWAAENLEPSEAQS